MTSDLNKGITSVEYNYLDLAEEINLGSKGKITYTYTAAGTKLQSVYNEGVIGVQNKTDYCGAFVYFNDRLSYILTSYGRIAYKYEPEATYEQEVSDRGLIYRRREYFLTDHLGNVRVVFIKDIAGLTIEDVLQDLWESPFGGTWSSGGGTTYFGSNEEAINAGSDYNDANNSWGNTEAGSRENAHARYNNMLAQARNIGNQIYHNQHITRLLGYQSSMPSGFDRLMATVQRMQAAHQAWFGEFIANDSFESRLTIAESDVIGWNAKGECGANVSYQMTYAHSWDGSWKPMSGGNQDSYIYTYYTSENTRDKQEGPESVVNVQAAVTYMVNELDAGRPLKVCVDFGHGNNPCGGGHMITMVGYGIDNGGLYFRYFENRNGGENIFLNNQVSNTLYYNVNTNTISYGRDSYYGYILTHIRPNIIKP
jgi:hypothetical protein